MSVDFVSRTPAPWVSSALIPFGKYFLVQKLAEGGMAEIFLAKQVGAEGFERDVVLKLMLNHLSIQPELVHMFLDEAKLAARLLHPNVVQILDLGMIDGRYYICMEYLAGEDVERIIRAARERKQHVPLQVAAQIITGACHGLDFAHAFRDGDRPLNLVHRDVSPSNVIVTYQGAVKLMDFGIAKTESQVVKTQAGMVKGKWNYMSPEQAKGESVDRRSDIFSLGLTLYELITLRRVFKRENELATLHAILNDAVPDPRQFRKGLPDAIVEILNRPLPRNPSDRYQTAGEMATDIETFVASSTSGSGSRQLSSYLESVFGREVMEGKTRVPTLKVLQERGAVVHPVVNRPASNEAPTRVSAAEAALGKAPPLALTAPRSSKVPATLIIAAAAAVGAVVAGVVVWRSLAKPEAVAPPVPPAPIARQDPLPTPTPVPTLQTGDPLPPPPAPPNPVPQPPPPPQPPRPSGPVKLTPKDIMQVVGRARGNILGCFDRHRTALPSGEGEVKLTLTIEKTGKVSKVSVDTPGFESNPLSDCVSQQVTALKFPRAVEEVTFRLPFVYKVAK
jgi:serine/threonine protein kinase